MQGLLTRMYRNISADERIAIEYANYEAMQGQEMRTREFLAEMEIALNMPMQKSGKYD